MQLPVALLALERESDRAFMEGVYLEFHRLMYAQALSVLRSPDAAQDAVSDALVALIKKIDTLRSLERNILRAYVVMTVRNTSINALRRRAAAGKREAGVPVEVVPEPPEGGAEQRLIRRERVEEVKRAIRALPPREADALMMRYFQQMTDEEIAATMGIRPVSVRALVSRAKARLARNMQGEGMRDA